MKGQTSTQGQWSAVQQWGLRAVHMNVLPTGKVLFWSQYQESLTPQIWDPATNNVTPAATVSYEVFCGGHAGLANGQLFVSGGAVTTNIGVSNASIYDPIAGTWTSLPVMNAGRWYPTSTTLANGDILTIGGNDQNGNPNTLPQVWSNATQSWVSLTSATLALQLYPRMFLAPNGQVFEAGTNNATRYLDTSGTGNWTVVGNYQYSAGRPYGSWVMYDFGKVLAVGGGDPPTNTAEIIDLTAATPAWTYTNSMANARRNPNATLLPDGKVLVTGGSCGGGFDDANCPVYPAEVWDPATGNWTTLASFTVYRGYHSTAALLPDGRVVSAGGVVGGPTAEIFSPPYLFNGPQPTITSAPPTITYGQTFFVGTPDNTSITAVNMLRLGAVTHAFNQNQRIAKLAFSQTTGGLNVTTPPDGIHAPPGYYMLFIINSLDVPSVAAMIQIGTPPAATVSPTGLTFASQMVGTSSASQTVSLTATFSGSSALLNPTSITTAGDFSQTNNCTPTVISGQSCTITVTFTPTGSGTRTGTVTIVDNATGSPQTVSLTGTGAGGPIVSLSPTSLSFGAQAVGVTSAAQTVTLTNTGTDILTINSITNTGANPNDFGQTNTCGTLPATVAAGANCTFSVTFTPSITGAESAAISIADNAPGTPHTFSLTGQGGPPAPLVTLTPTSISFGNQNVGTSSTAQTVTLQNTGTATLSITSIAATGTNKNDFSKTSTCGTSLSAGSSCTVSVTFKPAATGARSATLNFNDNAAGSPQTVSLTGTGTKPGTSLSPTSLSFGSQLVGTTSAAQTVTLTNTGTGTLTITSLTITGTSSGDYAQANTCGSSVAAGANCTVTVTFTPTTTGTRSASVSIADNSAGSPQAVSLTGTGTAPAASLSPTSESFANQIVGTTSSALTVTLANTGSATLTITSITLTGTNSTEFAQTNTCGTSVAAGANCTISVTFTPGATGSRNASISVADNATGSPQTVSLTGTGIAPAVSLSAASLSYGNQLVGTTSAAQTVTLTNTGTATLTITSVGVTGTNSGDFAQTNTCGSSVAAGGNCNISVTFAPSATGSRAASVNITDNASGSPQAIAVSGVGIAPAVTLTPTSESFGNQLVGTSSGVLNVTLQNSGTATLNITSIALTGTNTGDFAETNTCSTSVAAGANCTISVTFTPAANGSRTASISIADDATGSPQTVTLSGTGVTPAATLSPTSVTFANQNVGTTSAAQAITLTNGGTGTLTITSITLTGTNSTEFAQTNTCGTSVTAGATCTISATFTPAANGSRTASVSVADNAAGSPQTLSLTGTGVTPAASLSPTSLAYPSQQVSTASAAQAVTLTNGGTGTLTITSITFTGTNSGDFTQANTCGSSVAAGTSCTINATFTPSATGSRSATLNVNDNASGSPQTVGLSGTGIAPAVNLSPTSLSFGSQQVGTSSAAQQITLQNTGTAALNITSIAITGTNSSDFTQTNTCGSNVAVGASCTISATFTPTASGARSAAVAVTDNASDSPESVSLSGTGIAPVVSLSPATLTFGNQQVGTTGAAQTITLQNTGSAPLAITNIAVTGTNTGDFAQSNTCGSSVAVGASCTISATFTPTASGARSAAVTVTDNAGSGTQTVSLTGTGVVPGANLTPASVTFASQLIGTTSPAQTVTLQNTGGATLLITGVSISGTNGSDFADTTTCGSSLAAGASCTISVTFTPAAVGTRTASVSVTDNATGSPQAVSLTGTGTTGIPAVSLSATSIAFANQVVGTTSIARTITLTNTGNATLTITSIGITGTNLSDFAETNTCGTSVNAGANCTISVTFTPTATGQRIASVSIADNASGSPQTVSLSGIGLAASTISLTPSKLNFPKAVVGTAAAPQTITLTNTGTTTVTITTIGFGGTNAADFSDTNTCGSSVAAGASCTITVTFTPQAAGQRSATLNITDNATGSPQTATLTGTGTFVSVTPTKLTFASQKVGTSSAPQTVTVKNSGSTSLSMTAVTFSGTNPGDFSQTNTCGSSLAAGASCTISVTFKPTATGTRAASMTITDSDPASPQSVTLTGTGQ